MMTRSVFSRLVTTFLGLIIISCNNAKTDSTEVKRPDIKSVSKTLKKPPSTYPDTLVIYRPAAVFYHPDSLQLIEIKSQTDSMVFDGSMHEYFYQMRNARQVIKKNWPSLSVIESENYRFIVFIKADKTRYFVDLDTKPDAWGLFVFNALKSPLFVDMTNIDTELSFYLKQ